MQHDDSRSCERLKAEWRIQQFSRDCFLLNTEDAFVKLEGPGIERLLASLASKEESPEKHAEAIEPQLERLRHAGMIRESRLSADKNAEAFWERCGHALEERVIAWKSFCEVSESICEQLLTGSSLRLEAGAGRVVVTADDYLDPRLIEFMERESRPTLLTRPVGQTVLLGPIVNEGGPCYGCLAHWLRTRRAALSGLDADFIPQPATAAIAGSLAIGAGLLSTAATLWAAGETLPFLRGCVLALDTRRLDLVRCLVPPRSDCRKCSRNEPSAEYRRSLLDWANPVSGIVFDVRTTLRTVGGFHQCAALYAQPLAFDGARPLVPAGHSFGNGFSPKTAQEACIAEALERYSIVWRGDERTVRGSADELGALLPDDFLQFSPRQYAERESWNACRSLAYQVPEPLGATSQTDWILATNLVGGTDRLVPASLCYMWRPWEPGEPQFCNADTNGCAAAGTRVGALVHALLELIERDAVAIWWYNRLLRPEIEWASWEDNTLAGAIEELRRAGREPVLLDLTHDLGVPVVAAVIADRSGREPHFGCAAHLDGPTAARKALAEASQNWYWTTQGELATEWDAFVSSADLGSEIWLSAHGSTTPPGPDHASIDVAAETLLRKLDQTGLSCYAVDLTRPDVRLPAVRVLVPGLRHCWRRLAPGRLYDVPVSMGWLARPPRETDLNPVCCPL